MKQEFIPVKNISSPPKFDPSQRLYVRAFHGRFQQFRRYLGGFMLAIFALLPWIPFGERPAILIDLSAQQFHFFALTLFPQDLLLLALLLISAALALFFITNFFGRIWCGFLCPQTVWTFLFIWFEEKIEGAANKRRRQDALPITRKLIGQKLLKHLCWLTIALMTALTFVGYFIPIQSLISTVFTFSANPWIYVWVTLFTLCTYGNAGWMRTIMCVHMCPYARFQSAMFDRNTLIVGYDTKRGEPKMPRRSRVEKRAGQGDCIDCNLCVQVCPAGIDIRQGLQYECISCGACIDACDHTMTRIGLAPGLIGFTSTQKLSQDTEEKLRPKLIGYGALMCLTFGIFIANIWALSPVSMDVLRDRHQLSHLNDSGEVENTFTLKIINKTQARQSYELSVSGRINLTWQGVQQIHVDPGEIYTLPIRLSIPQTQVAEAITPIQFQLFHQEKILSETPSRFIANL